MTTRRIFVVLSLIGAVTAARLPAQTAAPLQLPLHDRVVSFTNLQGSEFRNADLIRADGSQLIFKTNDIYGAVQLTNLAPAVLDLLGVPGSYLDKVHAQAVAHAQATARAAAIWKAEQQRLHDPGGLISVSIESIISTDYDPLFGKLTRCAVRLTNGTALPTWVARLPDAIPAYLQKEQGLATQIAGLSRQIVAGAAQVDAQAADLNAAAEQLNQAQDVIGSSTILTPSVYYDGMYANPTFDVYSIRAARRGLRNASNDLDNARVQVTDWNNTRETLQNQLDQMKSVEKDALTVSVLVSNFKHYNAQVLVCAPPSPAVTTAQ